jgi:hypothetical protein
MGSEEAAGTRGVCKLCRVPIIVDVAGRGGKTCFAENATDEWKIF